MTTSGQTSKRKRIELLVLLCTPYVILVAWLALLGTEKIRALPRWVLWGMAGYFFATILSFAFLQWVLRRKTAARAKQSWEDPILAALGKRRVKRMFLYYGLSIVGGICFAIFGVIPWLYAVPGLILVSIFTVFYWRLLSRARRV